ncbi:hypothetical protein [Pseudoramibacter porci]|uniref:Uncharacterized protein n=1 Tax=Pseudoramibacter porci TaxID=2606631 RepID=A0A7X2NEF1_9FIRM|nr:hypothetical protein [Pseudoramibacter porci]MSS18860.1 hypothetical protein [Pseudoramibacter porci]
MNKKAYEEALKTDSALELVRIMYKNGYNLPEINQWPKELRERYENLTAHLSNDFNIVKEFF